MIIRNHSKVTATSACSLERNIHSSGRLCSQSTDIHSHFPFFYCQLVLFLIMSVTAVCLVQQCCKNMWLNKIVPPPSNSLTKLDIHCKSTEAQIKWAAPCNIVNKISSTSFCSLLLTDFMLNNFPNEHTKTHQSFPDDNGLCKWGIICMGQQGLSSLFEDYASISSDPA